MRDRDRDRDRESILSRSCAPREQRREGVKQIPDSAKVYSGLCDGW